MISTYRWVTGDIDFQMFLSLQIPTTVNSSNMSSNFQVIYCILDISTCVLRIFFHDFKLWVQIQGWVKLQDEIKYSEDMVKFSQQTLKSLLFKILLYAMYLISKLHSFSCKCQKSWRIQSFREYLLYLEYTYLDSQEV